MSNNNQVKRCLVAGGAGFLGSHLVDTLLKRGHEVICVDNLFTGSQENIKPFLSEPRFVFVHHDVVLPLSIDVDEIYNLACPASPVHYQSDPIQTIKTSVLGALNLLDLARKLKIKIFQASTSEVYGDPLVHPQTEQYWGHVNPIGIRSCYDEGKRCAESLFFNYHRQFQVDVRVVRIFNTYGPKMQPDDGRVVSNFILQALKGQDLTVYGDGEQTRSFCYVSDLIDAFIRFMDLTHDHQFAGPVNLGNPQEFTMLQLSKMIIEMTGSKSRIIHLPLPQDDPIKRKPDITLAQEKLGWSPTTDLAKGLYQTISYFDKLLRSSNNKVMLNIS